MKTEQCTFNVGDKVFLTDKENALINEPAEIERISGNHQWPYLVKWNVTPTSSSSAWYGESDLKLSNDYLTER